jgi:hypothetical protein
MYGVQAVDSEVAADIKIIILRLTHRQRPSVAAHQVKFGDVPGLRLQVSTRPDIRKNADSLGHIGRIASHGEKLLENPG